MRYIVGDLLRKTRNIISTRENRIDDIFEYNDVSIHMRSDLFVQGI